VCVEKEKIFEALVEGHSLNDICVRLLGLFKSEVISTIVQKFGVCKVYWYRFLLQYSTNSVLT